MKISNKMAAELFLELADLLDLAGELPFKSASYRKVAGSINELDEPLTEIIQSNQWAKIPGAGKAIKEKLRILSETGKIPALEKWRKDKIAAYYPMLNRLDLKPRPMGLLISKYRANDFKDLWEKLNSCNIQNLTGQSRETASRIIERGRSLIREDL